MAGDEQLTQQQVEVLVGAAGAAPSMHNTQPWRFELNGRVIDVYLDGSRSLPVEDPSGRAMRIAAGAAAFNLRVAAAHLGLDSWFGLVPDPDEPDLVARVVVAQSPASIPALGLLYGQIARRHTDRAPARPVDIPAADRVELQRAAFTEGAELTWLPTESLDRLLWLVVDADLRGVVDAPRTAERRHWIGGTRTVDGIPHDALGPRSTVYPSPVRDLSATPQDRRRPVARFEHDPVLAVLSTEGDGARDQLTAGMALQRVLLTATRRGLSASFLNQPLEYDDLRAHVQEITGKPGRAHMLMRFLPSVPHEPTPRRPVADFLEPAPAPEEVEET
jgi:Nitroreductase family